ncbi:MAG: diaminopimelate epimerase [Candidatus Coprovivens sp.]
MKFTKMHGLGNDYIYINDMVEKCDNYSELAIILSDRHKGIGGDGIITIGKSDKADFFMQIYNADGSKGEMCGNGIRCVGKYVYDNGLTNKTSLDIETIAGIKHLDLNIVDGKVESVKVDMGVPTCHDGSALSINKIKHEINGYTVYDISMGNPHTVTFVDNITDQMVLKDGPVMENDSYYSNRTNVEFIKIINNNEIDMRVWERGSGETMACGTGACASAVATMLLNDYRGTIIVHLLGGDLKITWLNNNHVIMEGSATKVYDGEFKIQDIINN